jgi:hypothetical protein
MRVDHVVSCTSPCCTPWKQDIRVRRHRSCCRRCWCPHSAFRRAPVRWRRRTVLECMRRSNKQTNSRRNARGPSVDRHTHRHTPSDRRYTTAGTRRRCRRATSHHTACRKLHSSADPMRAIRSWGHSAPCPPDTRIARRYRRPSRCTPPRTTSSSLDRWTCPRRRPRSWSALPRTQPRTYRDRRREWPPNTGRRIHRSGLDRSGDSRTSFHTQSRAGRTRRPRESSSSCRRCLRRRYRPPGSRRSSVRTPSSRATRRLLRSAGPRTLRENNAYAASMPQLTRPSDSKVEESLGSSWGRAPRTELEG